MPEIYISTDIEADGPIPGLNSMLQFGSAAYTSDKRILSTYTANLHLLPEAKGDPDTLRWWASNRAAYDATRTNQRDPAVVMPEYVSWLSSLQGTCVFVGFPATYDFQFLNYYLVRFTGSNPMKHDGIDIKTLAMVALGADYRDVSLKKIPRKYFDDLPHTHDGLTDAIEQGALFCNLLAETRKRTCP